MRSRASPCHRTSPLAMPHSKSDMPERPAVGRHSHEQGKWGPNHAADPIVTRFEPNTRQLQMVAIKRRDTGQWAIPGGMVDAGERASATVKREFMEEATAVVNQHRKERNRKLIDELFASADGDEDNVVYRGYVDDPRVSCAPLPSRTHSPVLWSLVLGTHVPPPPVRGAG